MEHMDLSRRSIERGLIEMEKRGTYRDGEMRTYRNGARGLIEIESDSVSIWSIRTYQAV